MQVSSTQSTAMNAAQEALVMAAKERPQAAETEAPQHEPASPPAGTGRVLNARA